MTKSIPLALAILILGGCSTNRNNSESDDVRLDSIELEGQWKLAAYRIDCETTEFDAESRYTLSFNEQNHSFGLTTDCNAIGGEFSVTNDTIRFANIAATEMACDNMDVEMNMLRLLNDPTAYAIYLADTLRYTAPSIGSATFIHIEGSK